MGQILQESPTKYKSTIVTLTINIRKKKHFFLKFLLFLTTCENYKACLENSDEKIKMMKKK